MTPTSARDQRYYPDRVTWPDAALPNALRSGATNHPAFKTDGATDIEVDLNVTAAAGGGSLILSLETSLDGGTTWYQVGAFAAKTGVSVDKKLFGPVGPDCRLVSTITGTSVTYDVTVKAKIN
jgi:hypothetical protein